MARASSSWSIGSKPQAAVAARINAILPGNATATNPRQGRNIGVSAIIAINDTQFLVLERDNRGIGVDDPAGANAVGSKRVFKIDITNATDVTDVLVRLIALPATVVSSRQERCRCLHRSAGEHVVAEWRAG